MTTELDGRVYRRLTPRSRHSRGRLLILMYSRARGAEMKADQTMLQIHFLPDLRHLPWLFQAVHLYNVLYKMIYMLSL